MRQALVFLSWDELPNDERPPRTIWRNGDKLKEWFDDVKEKREREMDPKRNNIEDPVDNEAAKGLIVG